MKVFQVFFDTMIITLIVEDMSEIFSILEKADDNFEIRGEDIIYNFSDESEQCQIREVTDKRGVIQWESH